MKSLVRFSCMLIINNMTLRFIIISVFATSLLSSCKKDDLVAPLTAASENITVSNKIKDSVLLYSRDIYLWNSQIPATFNAQSYKDPNEIMEAIRAYSIEKGFNQPVDRWSFAVKQSEWDDVSSGVAKDFGMSVFFLSETDLRVKFVEKASPAGKAGIQRGWRITSINGTTNISTANSDFIAEKVFYSTGTTFTFQKPDGSTINLPLTAATYQEHPVFLDSVYTVGSKKAGYLVFNSFLGDTTEVYRELDRAFNRFTRENVSELVIDLRYNGGGYVSVQERLGNYLVNYGGNGDIMMNQEFNASYRELNNTTRYSKSGSLNLNRVFFIVSNATASASELLINNLKPYMDVKLVGPANTYGKPVGFFPVPVDDWYIFPVSFRSTNKNGAGNYFNGIALDSRVADGLDKNWGDRNEACLNNAFAYIANGVFNRAAENQRTMQAGLEAIVRGNAPLDAHTFKGAIETRSWEKGN